MNTFVTKGKKLKSLAYTALAAAVATGAASAQLTTDAATTAITDATTKGTAVIVAGFAIGAVFLVAKVIRRGMRSAG
jgi:hypothetical protein